MILSLIVIFFIAAMVWMWAHQGLFSAVIHLMLTIIAAMAALALWEPFVYGFLIYRMPEQAWGMGLLIPFAVILLVLRTIFDKLVIGNLNFHVLADRIGGGTVGFVSGVLTAGLLVIGLQMVGMPSLFGFQAYTFDTGTGKVVRKDALLIPADTIAANFFTALGSGSLRPVLGNRALHRYHPDLARQASFFHQSAFWDRGHQSSMRAISPKHIRVADEYSLLGEVPRSLREQIPHEPHSQRLVAVGMEVLKVAEGTDLPASDAGAGAIIRFSRAQVALGIENSAGRTDLVHAVGYIQAGEYVSFLAPGTFAYTGAADRETFHWIFQIPAGWNPVYALLKHTRVELPAKVNPDPSAVESLIRVGVQIVDTTEPEPLDEGDPRSQLAAINNRLPFPFNRNEVTGVELTPDRKRLIAGEGTVGRRGAFVGDPLLVGEIYHADNVRIVRVDLGNRRRSQTIFGRSLDQAVYTQAPTLHTASGKRYLALGYAVTEGAGYRFKITPDAPIRSVFELDPARLQEESNMFVYFAVDTGETVTKFQLGTSQRHSYELNIPIPPR